MIRDKDPKYVDNCYYNCFNPEFKTRIARFFEAVLWEYETEPKVAATPVKPNFVIGCKENPIFVVVIPYSNETDDDGLTNLSISHNWFAPAKVINPTQRFLAIMGEPFAEGQDIAYVTKDENTIGAFCVNGEYSPAILTECSDKFALTGESLNFDFITNSPCTGARLGKQKCSAQMIWNLTKFDVPMRNTTKL